MTFPDDNAWHQVERIVLEIERLTPDEAVEHIRMLHARGEPPSILSLAMEVRCLRPLSPLLKTGDLLGGRYILREELGQGGMGTVWRATQPLIARDVAVKAIQPLLVTRSLCERFAREMEILGQLEHPGIVRIFDAGLHEHEEQTIPYFVMECVEGVPLNRWAAAQQRHIPTLLRLISEVCAAVQHAHDRRIVHRDLKPSNIMVRPNGQPVVLDFGVARLAGREDEQAGLFSGTPHYAAPEQHLGLDRDFRSGESVDVYATGAMLFETVTGRRLFDFSPETPPFEMRRQIVEGVPPRLADVLPDCPRQLDEIVARAVRRNPADRYLSIASLARALRQITTGLYGPPQPPQPAFTPSVGLVVPETNWRLVRKLGEGSTGEVWLAEHEKLDQRRVFKFCDSEEKVRTLKRELSLFRLLKERVGQNPHFITLHEVALEEPPWYLMMDFVDAEDLPSWCSKSPGGLAELDLETKVEIVAQAAEALQSAHEAGILHRDIKPENLLVHSRNGPGESPAKSTPALVHVYIADFGIGQIVADGLLRAGAAAGFTFTVNNGQSATFSGTIPYMAPETFGDRAASARSDIYSLGVVFWQLLTGNFQAPLDLNWPVRIADPLLRQDLARCLAGAPEQRWSSAGDFATSLRGLTARRNAQARKEAEQAARERAAYVKGAVRTACIALVILGIVITLAIAAWRERTNALQAKARGALEQADNILELGRNAGRPDQGLSLLKEAVAIPGERSRIRSLAAGFLSLAELRNAPHAVPATPDAQEVTDGDVIRATYPHGGLVATGRAINDVEGMVTLTNSVNGTVLGAFRRESFPWVPIPEAGFLQFSPNGKQLAVAGPETSMQILICDTASAELRSYLYMPGRLKCMSWHPSSRLLVTGGSDRLIRVWDVESAVAPNISHGGNDFSLPPKLTARVLDAPLSILAGARGELCSLAFHPEGTWLASLDDAGWLRIWSGFNPSGTPNLPPPGKPAGMIPERAGTRITLLVETKIELPGTGAKIAFSNGTLLARYPGGEQAFTIHHGSAFRETWLAPGIQKFSWAPDGKSLCAITAAGGAFLISLNDLASPRSFPDIIADEAAYDPVTEAWVLPNGEQYVLRTLRGTPDEKPLRIDLKPAEEKQGTRLGIAMSASGRSAVYFGKRLQFFHGSTPAPAETSFITNGNGGTFNALLWDRDGSLLSVVFGTGRGLHVENYRTSDTATIREGTLFSKADQLISAGDGYHLLERGTRTGISLLSIADGSRRLLDGTNAARQNAPFALSPDGQTIAAAFDQHTIRLVNASTGANYAELTSPRRGEIAFLAWDPKGEHIAATTRDGYVQVWFLNPWRSWLRAHDLATR